MDLNADIGEHDGEGFARDAELLATVTSASIACGAHAGSESVMRQTVREAAQRGVAIGAHPGYPDRAGFGRRSISMPAADLAAVIVAQVTALLRCCDESSTQLKYVKPHGALYNQAMRDAAIARTIARATSGIDPQLFVLAPANSALAAEAAAAGLRVAREAFIDRAYLDDGTLMPRDRDGAVLRNPSVAAERALVMARDKTITSASGEVIAMHADSLCIHGDSVDALAMVRAVRCRLEQAGMVIAPFAP